MERMLGLLAHDLRAHLALARDWLETDAPDARERSRAALDLALDMVEQALLVADGGRLEARPCDFWEALERVGAIHGVEVAHPEGPFQVAADPLALYRILQNLATNAREHGSGRLVGAMARDGSWSVIDPRPGLAKEGPVGRGFGRLVVAQLAKAQGWFLDQGAAGIQVRSAHLDVRPKRQG